MKFIDLFEDNVDYSVYLNSMSMVKYQILLNVMLLYYELL